jgi:hypothetical protein
VPHIVQRLGYELHESEFDTRWDRHFLWSPPSVVSQRVPGALPSRPRHEGGHSLHLVLRLSMSGFRPPRLYLHGVVHNEAQGPTLSLRALAQDRVSGGTGVKPSVSAPKS